MFQGVAVALWCSGGFAAVHPAPTVLHRAVAARLPRPSGMRSASLAQVHGPCERTGRYYASALCITIDDMEPEWRLASTTGHMGIDHEDLVFMIISFKKAFSSPLWNKSCKRLWVSPCLFPILSAHGAIADTWRALSSSRCIAFE